MRKVLNTNFRARKNGTFFGLWYCHSAHSGPVILNANNHMHSVPVDYLSFERDQREWDKGDMCKGMFFVWKFVFSVIYNYYFHSIHTLLYVELSEICGIFCIFQQLMGNFLIIISLCSQLYVCKSSLSWFTISYNFLQPITDD